MPAPWSAGNGAVVVPQPAPIIVAGRGRVPVVVKPRGQAGLSGNPVDVKPVARNCGLL